MEIIEPELQFKIPDLKNEFIKKIKDDDILGNALYDVKELQSYIDSGQVQAVNS